MKFLRSVLTKIFVTLLIFISFFSDVTVANAPLEIWAQRDNATGQGYGQSHRLDGDFDGDGTVDFAISAITWSTQTGRVFIYWGGSSISLTPDVTIAGETTNNRFGDGMSTGDFNGDGMDDLVIGAVRYSSYIGKNYIFYGRSRTNWASVASAAQADVKVTGEAGKTGHLGNKNALGDTNGDGYDDLLIGAEYYDTSYPGRAYLILGRSSSGLDINASAADTIINNDFSGVSSLGTEVDIADVTGDSKGDLLIAADSWLTTSENYRAIVFAGGSIAAGTINASTAALIISATGAEYSAFSYPMRGGDINGDGKKDLIIGCDHFTEAANLPKMFIFYGSSNLSGSKTAADADIIITGEEPGDTFSMTIAIGDINHDSVDDIVTNAYYGGPFDRGKLYVFFGGNTFTSKTLASRADYSIVNPHPEAGGYFSWWISAGDINNDGWDEFCGAVTSAAGVSLTAYIYSLSHDAPAVTIDSASATIIEAGQTVTFSGLATDPDGGNIQKVEYSYDGVNWYEATAQDGACDESSESYIFSLTLTVAGEYLVQVRATDSENATTVAEDYVNRSLTVTPATPTSLSSPPPVSTPSGASLAQAEILPETGH